MKIHFTDAPHEYVQAVQHVFHHFFKNLRLNSSGNNRDGETLQYTIDYPHGTPMPDELKKDPFSFYNNPPKAMSELSIEYLAAKNYRWPYFYINNRKFTFYINAIRDASGRYEGMVIEEVLPWTGANYGLFRTNEAFDQWEAMIKSEPILNGSPEYLTKETK